MSTKLTINSEIVVSPLNNIARLPVIKSHDIYILLL